MPLNIAIVEDSQENIDVLQYLLEKSPFEYKVLGVAKTVDEARLLLTRPDIDLALLDIQLKEDNIFKVLTEVNDLGTISFEVVFITAHGSYENALKAIQYSCLDFINKPIDQDELNQVLHKMTEKQSSNQSGAQIAASAHRSN